MKIEGRRKLAFLRFAHTHAVTPAEAGVQLWEPEIGESWIPAFAGMTVANAMECFEKRIAGSRPGDDEVSMAMMIAL